MAMLEYDGTEEGRRLVEAAYRKGVQDAGFRGARVIMDPSYITASRGPGAGLYELHKHTEQADASIRVSLDIPGSWAGAGEHALTLRVGEEVFMETFSGSWARPFLVRVLKFLRAAKERRVESDDIPMRPAPADARIGALELRMTNLESQVAELSMPPTGGEADSDE